MFILTYLFRSFSEFISPLVLDYGKAAYHGGGPMTEQICSLHVKQEEEKMMGLERTWVLICL